MVGDVHRFVILILVAWSSYGVKITPCDTSLWVQAVDVIAVRHSPHPLCTGCEVTFEIEAASMSDHLILLGGSADILFCHRYEDCMFVSAILREENLCPLLVVPENVPERECSFSLGRRLVFNVTMTLPNYMFRGSYDVLAKVHIKDKEPACFWFQDINVVAGNTWTNIRDYFSAFVGFVTASASSYVLGQYFPKITRGFLPQISGFLLLGVVVGPYMTNFVSRFYIYLLDSAINRTSLGFISLAAAAEIYFPHLQEFCGPIGWTVSVVTLSTFLFVSTFLVVLSNFIAIPLLDENNKSGVSWGIAFLMASIMAARSPSSAVAVTSEMNNGHTVQGKIMLGVTVASDLVVLVLFACCIYVVELEYFSTEAFLSISISLFVSGLYGLLFGLFLRGFLILLPSVKKVPESNDIVSVNSHGGKKINDLPWFILLNASNKLILFKGLVVLGTVYSMWQGSWIITHITGIKIDHLLVPFFASLYVGHSDQREDLAHVLHAWMPAIFLPFFTLTGASLDLGLLGSVLPWSLLITVARLISIWVGAYVSGYITDRPEKEKNWMGLTLVSQAGISLGLALEVQKKFVWGRDFSSVVIGVVVLNQLLGPILCRIGMLKMVGEMRPAKIRTGSKCLQPVVTEQGFTPLFAMDESHADSSVTNSGIQSPIETHMMSEPSFITSDDIPFTVMPNPITQDAPFFADHSGADRTATSNFTRQSISQTYPTMELPKF